jgi:hypothetical protein
MDFILFMIFMHCYWFAEQCESGRKYHCRRDKTEQPARRFNSSPQIYTAVFPERKPGNLVIMEFSITFPVLVEGRGSPAVATANFLSLISRAFGGFLSHTD